MAGSKKQEPIKVDLTRLLDQGDMSLDMTLHSDDVIYIPLEQAINQTELKIFVEGEVKKPGDYDYRPGLTALNACIIAGGFAQYAAPNRARIIRNQGKKLKIIKIDLDDVRLGKSKDVELKPGDRINIPETYF